MTAEEILREYVSFDDINGNETVELLPLTIVDAMEEFANQRDSSLSWIEKDRLAETRLNEMRAFFDNSILNEVSSKVLRRLIIEGINIGLNYH